MRDPPDTCTVPRNPAHNIPPPHPMIGADDSTAEIAAQALGAIVLGGAGAAGLVGGSVLGSAQKL